MYAHNRIDRIESLDRFHSRQSVFLRYSRHILVSTCVRHDDWFSPMRITRQLTACRFFFHHATLCFNLQRKILPSQIHLPNAGSKNNKWLIKSFFSLYRKHAAVVVLCIIASDGIGHCSTGSQQFVDICTAHIILFLIDSFPFSAYCICHHRTQRCTHKYAPLSRREREASKMNKTFNGPRVNSCEKI